MSQTPKTPERPVSLSKKREIFETQIKDSPKKQKKSRSSQESSSSSSPPPPVSQNEEKEEDNEKSKFPIPFKQYPTLQHGKYTKEELRSVIKERGYCVITSVLEEEAVEMRKKQLFDAYASIYDGSDEKKTPLGFDLNDPATLSKGNTPPFKGTGIVNVDKVCSLLTLQEMRLDERLGDVFKKYYDVSDLNLLAKSNDRWGAMLPNNARTELEPHVDANATDCLEKAIQEDMLQGLVVLQGGSQEDQGFVIYSGIQDTDPVWKEIAKTAKDQDWCPIPKEFRENIGQGYVINAPPGSMIVWKSTAVHGNTSGAGKKTKVGRIVVYISMYPWDRILDENKDVLERSIVEKTTLGHNVLRPAQQTTGAASTRAKTKLQWEFKSDLLTNYSSVEDLPQGLRRPKKS